VDYVNYQTGWNLEENVSSDQ